ncbi:hypothetical protein K9F62_15120 [Desulfovibrio sp. JY]|nr:hypothetical protein K9F62_15120 [Desulfovibrio sp. JY]
MLQTILRAVLAAVLLICAQATPPARAAEPVLTILFTGNTYGNVAPCPS